MCCFLVKMQNSRWFFIQCLFHFRVILNIVVLLSVVPFNLPSAHHIHPAHSHVFHHFFVFLWCSALLLILSYIELLHFATDSFFLFMWNVSNSLLIYADKRQYKTKAMLGCYLLPKKNSHRQTWTHLHSRFSSGEGHEDSSSTRTPYTSRSTTFSDSSAGSNQGRRCSHSTCSLDDHWAAFPWVQPAPLGRGCNQQDLPRQSTLGHSGHVSEPGPSPAGGPVMPGPPFKFCAPPFHVWFTGCCIHPIWRFKNVVPLLVFGPPCCEILWTGLGWTIVAEISRFGWEVVRHSRLSQLCTLICPEVSPRELRKNPVSAAGSWDRALSVITHDSWP